MGAALVRYELDGARFPRPPDDASPDLSDDSPEDSGRFDEGSESESTERPTRAQPTASEETALPFFVAPRSVARLFRAVLCSLRRQLQRDGGRPVTEGEAFGVMLAHALEAWGADDPTVRRAHRVFDRDDWRCTAPGCTSYRNLHDHHVRFRSAGGSDALSNRTTLCAWHHQRGVHAGVVRCTGEAPGRLRFELGVRSGGPPLVVYRSGDVAVAT